MESLLELVGRERSLRQVAQTLHFGTREMGPGAVGALLVTCADESEHECVETFQRNFSLYVLPRLKDGQHSGMHVGNLGARYEWGAVKMAEQHFSTASSGFRMMVVKVNAHVAFEEIPGPTRSAAAGSPRCSEDPGSRSSKTCERRSDRRGAIVSRRCSMRRRSIRLIARC